MNQKAQTISPAVKKPSGRASIPGAILSVLALIFSATGYAFLSIKYKSAEPVVTGADKAGEAVASGIWSVLAIFLSLPMVIAGIVLGILGIVFTLIRLKKVNTLGFVFSLLWLALSVWAIKIALTAFNLMDAK